MYDKVENFLEHYGVKGQKWGVRKQSAGSWTVDRHNRKVAERQAKGKKARSEQIGLGIRKVAEMLHLVGPLPVPPPSSPIVSRGRSAVDQQLRELEMFERHDPNFRLPESSLHRLDRSPVMTEAQIRREVARSRREDPHLWE